MAATENGKNPVDTNIKSHNKLTEIVQTIKTGDTAEIMKWAGILGLSAIIIFLLLLWKRKENEEEQAYKDGTTVIVKIASTSPYKKTLTMKFILYATDTTLKDRITDSSGSPYAELVLMTNVEGNNGVKPYLNWSKELEIDNTNPLTFTQQSGMTEKNM